jgi:hypothetical protein
MNVAVVGYDWKLSCDACIKLAHNDTSSLILKIQKHLGWVLMNDGTIYYAISDSIKNLHGQKRFDQLIVVDDARCSAVLKRIDVISWMIDEYNLLDADWQIQTYIW